MLFFVNFLVVLRQILIILIFIRVIFSWFAYRNKYVTDTTDWILKPFSAIIPPVGGVLDLSPILALLFLQYIGDVVINLLLSLT